MVQCGSTNFSSLIISYLKYLKIVDPINGQYIGYLTLQFNMPDLLGPQPYKIVITRFFFPVLHFKLLRKIHGTMTNFLAYVFSINNKNCNYKPGKSFITQNHLLILWKKHREKIYNTGKTQGILSRLECGHPV